MFMRIAVACFALYCVHGAQNTARDSAALTEAGVAMARDASAQAPRAALAFCLENQSLCAKAVGAGQADAPAATSAPAKAAAAPEENYPLPPRRPAAHKRA